MTPERQDSPDAGGRYLSLQVLRFVAAMMVTGFHTRYLVPAVLGHVGFGQPGFLQVGDAGVDIFFVLSGFVIALTGPLASDRPSALLFFWRRWRRVAPIYLILSAPMIWIALRAGTMTLGAFASTFLFWPLADGRPTMPLLTAGWTLCFEMTFYATVALMLAGGRFRRNLLIGAGAWSLVVAAERLGWRTPLGSWLSNGLFLEFLAGFALAGLRNRLARLGPVVGMAMAALALAWFVALGVGQELGPLDPRSGYLDGSLSWMRIETYAPPATLMVAGAIASEPWVKGPLARLLASAGDASFSIYLMNLYAMAIAVGVWKALHWPAGAVGISGAALAWGGGLLIYRFVEKPVLRDLKSLRWVWSITLAEAPPDSRAPGV